MYITQVSFGVTEAVMYLDTHPCDAEAMSYYQKMRKLRKEALDRRYGRIISSAGIIVHIISAPPVVHTHVNVWFTFMRTPSSRFIITMFSFQA